jgi:hypothetical protein
MEPRADGDPAVEASALAWSVTAMSEATGRLGQVKARDKQQALAAIGEAVWWITMVDATLVRHHLGIYDAAMAALEPAERVLIEQTLTGLRFVRNWIGRDADLGEVIDTDEAGAGSRRVSVRGGSGSQNRRSSALRPVAWEMARYRAYQAQLAGRTVAETLGRAVALLTLTGAAITAPGERAARP